MKTIAEIITRFDLQGNIGFFIADNAINNDTCIEALVAEFTFNATERRLRCAGHIFNLIARALLWGTDEEAFLKALTSVKLAAEELECWRRRGPLSKVTELYAFNDTRWNSVFDALRVFIKVRPAIDDFYHKTLRDWQDYWNKLTDFDTKLPPKKMRKKLAILTDFIT
ncbi:hypothetical protein D6C80_06617 [Aureobasidium pullulans]|nr:hypothetical protein D6C80_06617 [Aureobasidium pullulans]